MYQVDIYRRVRLAGHRDGISQRELARRFGIDRKTISKILKHSTPPGYQRSKPPRRPKLDPFIVIIDQILIDDKDCPKKQRHTAKRIFERLRDEHGFEGGITIVTDYIREKKRQTKEAFEARTHWPCRTRQTIHGRSFARQAMRSIAERGFYGGSAWRRTILQDTECSG